MNEAIDKNRWVYILIQNPGDNEEYVAFEEDGVNFVPAFDTKEEAASWKQRVPGADESKLEVQAFFLTELRRETIERGYRIYILDNQGQKKETF